MELEQLKTIINDNILVNNKSRNPILINEINQIVEKIAKNVTAQQLQEINNKWDFIVSVADPYLLANDLQKSADKLNPSNPLFEKIVKGLISLGVDVNKVENMFGQTLLEVCAEKYPELGMKVIDNGGTSEGYVHRKTLRMLEQQKEIKKSSYSSAYSPEKYPSNYAIHRVLGAAADEKYRMEGLTKDLATTNIFSNNYSFEFVKKLIDNNMNVDFFSHQLVLKEEHKEKLKLNHHDWAAKWLEVSKEANDIVDKMTESKLPILMEIAKYSLSQNKNSEFTAQLGEFLLTHNKKEEFNELIENGLTVSTYLKNYDGAFFEKALVLFNEKNQDVLKNEKFFNGNHLVSKLAGFYISYTANSGNAFSVEVLNNLLKNVTKESLLNDNAQRSPSNVHIIADNRINLMGVMAKYHPELVKPILMDRFSIGMEDILPQYFKISLESFGRYQIRGEEIDKKLDKKALLGELQKLFTETGFNILQPLPNGQPVISLASFNENALDLLRNSGASVDAGYVNKNTMLHNLSAFQSREILKLKPNINAINNEGNTPLLDALQKNDLDKVYVIFMDEAADKIDFSIVNKKGETFDTLFQNFLNDLNDKSLPKFVQSRHGEEALKMIKEKIELIKEKQNPSFLSDIMNRMFKNREKGPQKNAEIKS